MAIAEFLRLLQFIFMKLNSDLLNETFLWTSKAEGSSANKTRNTNAVRIECYSNSNLAKQVQYCKVISLQFKIKKKRHISIWKDAPQHMSSQKYKLGQWHTNIHLLKWPKSGTLTPPNADKDGGNAKWYSHSGRQFKFFPKWNIVLSYNPAIMILGILLQTSWKHMSTQKPEYGCFSQPCL